MMQLFIQLDSLLQNNNTVVLNPSPPPPGFLTINPATHYAGSPPPSISQTALSVPPAAGLDINALNNSIDMGNFPAVDVNQVDNTELLFLSEYGPYFAPVNAIISTYNTMVAAWDAIQLDSTMFGIINDPYSHIEVQTLPLRSSGLTQIPITIIAPVILLNPSYAPIPSGPVSVNPPPAIWPGNWGAPPKNGLFRTNSLTPSGKLSSLFELLHGSKK